MSCTALFSFCLQRRRLWKQAGGFFMLCALGGSWMAQAQPRREAPPQMPAAPSAPPAKETPKKGTPALPATFSRVPTLPANAIWPVVMNYTFWNDSLMASDVQINGVLERCIVDTGLNACIVTPDASNRLKLSLLPTQITVATLNETRLAPETELKKVQINALKLDSLHVGVVNASELYTGAADPNAPGIWLGTPFLAAFQVTFDYTSHLITLDKPEAPFPKDKGAVILPLEMRDGHLYARVTIPKAGSFSALINTGAMGTLIPATIAAKLKLKPTKTFVVKRPGGRQAKMSLLILPQLQLGRLTQEQVSAFAFETEETKTEEKKTEEKKTEGNKLEEKKTEGSGTKAKKAEGNEPKKNETKGNEPKGNPDPDQTLGVLGADVLSHYKLTINVTRLKMILVPPPPKPTDPDNILPDPTKKPPGKNGGRNGGKG